MQRYDYTTYHERGHIVISDMDRERERAGKAMNESEDCLRQESEE